MRMYKLNKSKLFITVYGAIFFSLSIASGTAVAESNVPSVGQGFEISPPVVELRGKPGETLSTSINLRNTTKLPINAHAITNDFTAKDNSGAPGILVDGADAPDTGMRKWFSPVPDEIIQPFKLQNYRVLVSIPLNASPGGHYGVLRFTSASTGTNGGNGVSLTASVGTLFLVSVDGKTTHALSMAGFHALQGGKNMTWFQKSGIDFIERLHNDGNVHEKPLGALIIMDIFHHKVAQIPVNIPPGNILPSSYREFSQHVGQKLFGFYSAHLYISYANGREVEARSLNFAVLPTNFIIFVLVLLILIIIFFRRFQLTPRTAKQKRN